VTPDWVGRAPELGLLRRSLDDRLASVLTVTGLRGIGKSALVRRVLTDYEHATLVCPPLPEQAIIAHLGRVLRAHDSGSPDATPPSSAREETPVAAPQDWSGVFDLALQRTGRGGAPFVLVLDDAHRLAHAHSRHREALTQVILRARTEGRALHVVLVGGSDDRDVRGDYPEVAGPPLKLEPLHFRAASRMLPGRTPRERIRAYALFGGVPRVLSRLDPSISVGANVRKLLLAPDGPLVDVARTWLERDVQNPTRYYTILSALAKGERTWGQIRTQFPEPTTSGQIAPYLRTLERLGLIRARTSLDARPGSRSRRYEAADPFLMTWFRFVFPHLHSPEPTKPQDVFTRHVRPSWDDHTSAVLPRIGRDFMEHDAIEVFGSNARESGSIWSSQIEIPVAGVLASGAAYYGHTHWGAYPPGSKPLDSLDRQIRETRFAYGRERRLRLLVIGHALPRTVERALVRRLDAFAIGPDDLMG